MKALLKNNNNLLLTLKAMSETTDVKDLAWLAEDIKRLALDEAALAVARNAYMQQRYALRKLHILRPRDN